MRISKEKIQVFQKLYKRKFGEDLSWSEAYEKGARLVNLVKIIHLSGPADDSSDSADKKKYERKRNYDPRVSGSEKN